MKYFLFYRQTESYLQLI